MGIDVRAAGREPLGRRFHRGRRQDSVRPLARSRAAAAAPATRSSRPAQAGGPFTRPVRLLRAGRSAGAQPGDDRNADQGRRVRFARRASGRSLHGRDRPGRAMRARRSPPTARAARSRCSAAMTTTSRPPSRRRRCPTCPNGPTASGPRWKRKCSASISPAIRSPSTSARSPPTARTPRPTCPQLKDRAEVILGGMLSSHQVLAHQEPAAGQAVASTPCSTWKTSTARSAASSGPTVRRVRPPGRGRHASCVVRGVDRPPRRRGGEPDRQRADPARPARLALHHRHRRPHRRRREHGAGRPRQRPRNRPLLSRQQRAAARC